MRNLNLNPKNLLKRWGPPILLLLAFLAFVIWINQVDKTQLVSREGQTFEKAVVTEIIQDNLMPDGSRVGEQRIMVRMLTGPKEGEELEITLDASHKYMENNVTVTSNGLENVATPASDQVASLVMNRQAAISLRNLLIQTLDGET